MTVPRIDKDACISCGECIDMCPDLFQWGEDGKAEVVNKDGCDGCDCEEAADACPTDAILLKDK